MIHTIIFDIGNVLADFHWDRYAHTLFTDEDLIARLDKAIFQSGLWTEFDRGVMENEEIIAQMVSKDLEIENEIHLILQHSGGSINQMDYAIPWIQSLKKQGFQILFLSNYSHRLRKQNPEALSFLDEMDGGVFSYEVNLIKPDPAIYQCICEKYKLIPSQAVFIDDMSENISAAAAFGLNTVQFQNYEDATKKLELILEKNR